MKKALSRGIALAATFLLGAALMTPTYGDIVPPWESTNPSGLPDTKYWGYDFDDGILFPPTITSEGGNSGQPNDPVWSISGSGDIVSIVNGRSGIQAASQPSSARYRLDVPNTYNTANITCFWFAYDFIGQAPIPSAGTTSESHIVSGITYSPNSVGNHVEGYITIDPQPEDEWLEIRLTAGIGETNAIDNLMTGTSSIPEPAALGLLGLVSTGIFFKRRFFIA